MACDFYSQMSYTQSGSNLSFTTHTDVQQIEKHHLLLVNNDKYRQRLSAEENQYLERYGPL